MDAKKLASYKSFIKNDNPDMRRLASLRPPRDYTLGGSNPPPVKQEKKKYVPNLNVTRNRHRPKQSLRNIPSQPQQQFNKPIEKKIDANRFIQSSGVFAEGIFSDVKKVAVSRWRNDKENDGGTSSTLAMPTIKKKASEVNQNVESNVLNELTGCDEDFEAEKVPFQPLMWNNKFVENNKESKTENCDELLDKMYVKKLIGNTNEYLNTEQFSDYHPSLSLWRLPDTFAKKAYNDDPENTETLDYCLNNMPEGQIGKLVIRRSGRMEVQIGSFKYELEKSPFESFKEDVMALDPNKNDENKGYFKVLGGIRNKYMLTPDWETILANQELSNETT